MHRCGRAGRVSAPPRRAGRLPLRQERPAGGRPAQRDGRCRTVVGVRAGRPDPGSARRSGAGPGAPGDRLAAQGGLRSDSHRRRRARGVDGAADGAQRTNDGSGHGDRRSGRGRDPGGVDGAHVAAHLR